LLASCRPIVSVLVVCALVAAPFLEARETVVGVIVQAEHAQLGEATAASIGSTVFDGDYLATFAQGSLRLRAGSTLVYLGSESGMSVRQSESGMAATLGRGMLIFSTTKAGTQVLADGASLRPVADVPTVAQIRILGPKDLHVVAERGALQFTYDGETEVIPEGASYRVVLDPPLNMPTGQQAPEPTHKSGKSRRKFLFLIFGAGAAVLIWTIHDLKSSESHP